MKKLLSLLSITLLMSSCGSKLIDPLAGCEKSAAKFSDAAAAFVADFTNKTKCEAFKSAATSYIKDCPTLLASEVKQANDSIKDLDCNKL